VPQAEVWELDFCSRPILDERGKKVWELIICDPQRTFEYAQYVPNNKINSTEVRGRQGRCGRALQLQRGGALGPEVCQGVVCQRGTSS
jgi:hypothetical protein